MINNLNLVRLTYTYIRSNVFPLTPLNLANLSIESTKGGAGAQKRDGIWYLMDIKKQGIQTPLMEEYEKEILRLTSTTTLIGAWCKIRRKGWFSCLWMKFHLLFKGSLDFIKHLF